MIKITLDWYEKFYTSKKELVLFSDLQIKSYINKSKRNFR